LNITNYAKPPTVADYRTAVAAEVRAQIARAGKLQAHIADATGIPRQTLSKRLNAETKFPVEELIAIAQALGVPASTFLATVDGEAA